MTVSGHLVTFAAATDLEENRPGYSEIDTNLPSGICVFNETAVDRNGNTYLVNPDPDGYESRKCQWKQEKSTSPGPYDWVEIAFKRINGFKEFGFCVKEKIAERSTRNEVAQRVRRAKSKAEAIQILEEFHREPYAYRKITALNLDCMKEVREIRAREKLRFLKGQRQASR